MADASAIFWTGFFSVGGSLGLYWSTRVWDKRRDRIQDQRALRDAKRERLRETYMETLSAAETMRGMATELILEAAGYPRSSSQVEKQPDQAFIETIERNLLHFNRHRTLLALESDDRGVGQAFDDLKNGYFRFHVGLHRRHEGKSVSIEELDPHIKMIGDSIKRITQAAREHLAELERSL